MKQGPICPHPRPLRTKTHLCFDRQDGIPHVWINFNNPELKSNSCGLIRLRCPSSIQWIHVNTRQHSNRALDKRAAVNPAAVNFSPVSHYWSLSPGPVCSLHTLMMKHNYHFSTFAEHYLLFFLSILVIRAPNELFWSLAMWIKGFWSYQPVIISSSQIVCVCNIYIFRNGCQAVQHIIAANGHLSVLLDKAPCLKDRFAYSIKHDEHKRQWFSTRSWKELCSSINRPCL